MPSGYFPTHQRKVNSWSFNTLSQTHRHTHTPHHTSYMLFTFFFIEITKNNCVKLTYALYNDSPTCVPHPPHTKLRSRHKHCVRSPWSTMETHQSMAVHRARGLRPAPFGFVPYSIAVSIAVTRRRIEMNWCKAKRMTEKWHLVSSPKKKRISEALTFKQIQTKSSHNQVFLLYKQKWIYDFKKSHYRYIYIGWLVEDTKKRRTLRWKRSI